MKWYIMPIAVVAYAMLAVLAFVTIFYRITDEWPSEFWQIVGITAVVFLVLAFVLEKLNLHWELTVLLQVALVLGPILYFVNNREAYKPPVFVFLVNVGYEGPLEITFADSAETQIKKRADTLFFPFDVEGKLVLQEDYRMVKAAMEKRCYFMYTDRTRKLIPFVARNGKLPADSTQSVLLQGETDALKSKMKVMRYEVKRSNQVKW